MTVPMASIAPEQRPRERLARLGPAALSDAELLALVVRSGVQGRSALEVSQELLAEHGSLAGLAGADLDRLAAQPALGPAKASSIAAAFELGRRLALAGQPAPRRVTGPGDLALLGRRALTDPAREEVVVVTLGLANQVKAVENLTRGTADRCLAVPRDILAVVLRHGGAAFALVHSHPSGDPTPSAADLALTKELTRATEAVGVRFVDHVIVAGTRWRSVMRLQG